MTKENSLNPHQQKLKKKQEEINLFNNLIAEGKYKEIQEIIEQRTKKAFSIPTEYLDPLINSFENLPPDLKESIFTCINKFVQKSDYTLIYVLDKYQENFKFIEKVFDLNFNNLSKELFFQIIQKDNLIELLKKLLKTQINNTSLFRMIIEYSLDFYMIDLLKQIKNLNEKLFNEIIGSYPEEKISKIEKIIDVPSPNVTSKLMNQFVNGFGNVKYEGGLLTCAQLADRKKYTHMLVLNSDSENNEFGELIKYISDNLKKGNIIDDLSIKFMISGVHWACGRIDLNSKGEIKIILIDPLEIHYQHSITYNKLIPTIKEYFPDNSKIYLSNIQKQNFNTGCSVFALDDFRHLFTCDQYLPNPYRNLFDFLEANKKETYLEANTSYIELPLHLMRNLQSRKLLSMLEEDGTTKFNKKGETPAEFSSKFFQNVEYKGENKLMNRRLEYILSKLAKQNFNYLSKYNDQEIENSMQQFTLQGFKNNFENNIHRSFKIR